MITFWIDDLADLLWPRVPDDGDPGLAEDDGSGDDDPVTGAAILVVILATMVGRGAWKHSNSGASLAALLGLIIGIWLIFAIADPAGGGAVAVDAAKGISALAVGIGKILATF